jgi:dimethylargininase
MLGIVMPLDKTNTIACRFSHALLRKAPGSAVNGLRAVDRGAPSIDGIRAEHAAYVAALEKAGVAVHVLPALEAYPDSLFIEDPALVFGDTAILLRPGAPSRLGEAAAIRPTLETHFQRVIELPGQGFAEGGDVLTLGDRVMIGLSARTSHVGAKALISVLESIGRNGVIVETPPDVLHFKTDCAPLGDGIVLSTERLARSGVFDGLELVLVPEGEEAAANALRVNDLVFVGSGFPKTIAMLTSEGFNVVPLPVVEIGKIDAGLSCMSLRWQSP